MCYGGAKVFFFFVNITYNISFSGRLGLIVNFNLLCRNFLLIFFY